MHRITKIMITPSVRIMDISLVTFSSRDLF